MFPQSDTWIYNHQKEGQWIDPVQQQIWHWKRIKHLWYFDIVENGHVNGKSSK